MIKSLIWIVALALICTMTIVATAEPSNNSEPSTDKVLFDASVFEVPEMIDALHSPYLPVECGDGDVLKLAHYFRRDDVHFFKWCGGDEKMLLGGGCISSGVVAMPTIVFWNGVPDFPKDLFKYSENGTDDVYIPDSVTEIDEDCFVKGSHITLHFTKNNTVALAYAQTRGMAFEVMDGERVPGDVNFDQETDMKDVLALRKCIANLPAAYEIYSTDVNGDGSTDMKDVLALRKQIAHAEA